MIGCDMDAGDTAKLSLTVSGGAKVVDIYGDGNLNSYFKGLMDV